MQRKESMSEAEEGEHASIEEGPDQHRIAAWEPIDRNLISRLVYPVNRQIRYVQAEVFLGNSESLFPGARPFW
jgi:hypothetical protein